MRKKSVPVVKAKEVRETDSFRIIGPIYRARYGITDRELAEEVGIPYDENYNHRAKRVSDELYHANIAYRISRPGSGEVFMNYPVMCEVEEAEALWKKLKAQGKIKR